MSLFLLALAGAVIPCLLWLWFFYSRDRHDPEPVGLIIRLFLIGALPVAFVAGIVNAVALLVIAGGDLSGDRALLLLPVLAIGIAPVAEETLKYWGAKLGAWRSKAFNEPMDGIIYGTTVGLGFAAAETTDYLVQAWMGVGPLGSPIDFCDAGLECFAVTAFLRGMGSAVLHATASGIAGYGMSRRRLEGRPVTTAIGFVLLAMVVHALWNTASFLVLVIPVVVYAQLVKGALERSPFVARAVVPERYWVPERFGVPGTWPTGGAPAEWRGGPPPPGSRPPTWPAPPPPTQAPRRTDGPPGPPGPNRGPTRP
ncbi:MAG: PrsW family glutamic-type intramembrane protease [Actinomycetota bacterium]